MLMSWLSVADSNGLVSVIAAPPLVTAATCVFGCRFAGTKPYGMTKRPTWYGSRKSAPPSTVHSLLRLPARTSTAGCCTPPDPENGKQSLLPPAPSPSGLSPGYHAL